MPADVGMPGVVWLSVWRSFMGTGQRQLFVAFHADIEVQGGRVAEKERPRGGERLITLRSARVSDCSSISPAADHAAGTHLMSFIWHTY